MNATLRRAALRPAALRPAAIVALALAIGLSGCAGSDLRDRWEEEPHGRFGEAARREATVPPADPAPAAPQPPPSVGEAPADISPAALDAAAQATDGDAAAPSAAEGPVGRDDLAAAGVPLSLSGDAIAAVQAAGWSPDRALAYAAARDAFLLRNPDVAAAVERYRASFTRYDQVDWLNDLVRQYDAFGRDLRTDATTPHLRSDPRTAFPLQGVVALQGRIVDVDVAAARVTLEREVREALVSFEEAWQGARYWQRAARVLRTVHALAARVEESAEALYRTGRTPHASLIQAQMRAADLRERLTTARRRLDAERATLAALLDVPGERLSGARLKLDVDLPDLPPRDEAREAALAHGPTVEAARLDVVRVALMVQLVERQLLPNLSPGFSYQRLGDEERSGVAAPRGDIRYATGGPFLRELRHRRDAARDALAQAERLIPARAEQRWVALDDALRRRRLNAGAQFERARQAVDVAERGYGAGTVSFVDLDRTLRWRLDVSLAAAAALRDAFVENARLAVVVGAPGPAIPAAADTDGHEGGGATPPAPEEEREE